MSMLLDASNHVSRLLLYTTPVNLYLALTNFSHQIGTRMMEARLAILSP